LIFSTDHPSLDVGKISVNLQVLGSFRYSTGISGPQSGSCTHFHGQNRGFKNHLKRLLDGFLELPVAVNFKEASKNFK
jgi:hypothetical protein